METRRTVTVHHFPQRRARGVPAQWVCRTCEVDIGTPTSVVASVTLCPRTNGRKLSGGTRAYVCAHCLARGVVTVAR